MAIKFGFALALITMAAAGCGSSSGSPGNLCAGQTVDLQTDALNCGSCGNVCPKPPHANAVCAQATCGSGPCDDGYGGLDCQTCLGDYCHGLPETGAVFQAFAAGSSYGDLEQSSLQGYVNIAVLGESTPSPEGGFVSEVSDHYENVNGLNSILH